MTGLAMAIYKYCGSDVVDFVAGGSLQFGSLAWFRQLETVQLNKEIGDRLEGMVEISLPNINTGDRSANDEERGALAIARINPSEARIAATDNVVRRSCGHWHVLCLSNDPALKLSEKGYDACVEISDLHVLHDCIINTGIVEGRPLTDFFDVTHRTFGPVDYERDLVVTASNVDTLPQPHPLYKRADYQTQSEIRIALKAIDPMLRDIVRIEIKPPPGLLNIVARNDGLRDVGDPPLSDAEFLAKALELILKIKAFERETDAQVPLFPIAAGAELHQQRTVLCREMYFRDMELIYWEGRRRGFRGEWEIWFLRFPGTRWAMLGLLLLGDAIDPDAVHGFEQRHRLSGIRVDR